MRSIAKRPFMTKYAVQSVDGKTSCTGSTDGDPSGPSGLGGSGFFGLATVLIGKASPRLFVDAARCGERLMRGSTVAAACGSL
jgi:hypothetical protein